MKAFLIAKKPCCKDGSCYALVVEQEGMEHHVSVNPVNDTKGKPRRIDCDTCYTCIRVFSEEASNEDIFDAAFEHIKKHIIVPFKDET